MKRRVGWTACLVLLLICGCITVGKKFNYENVPRLKVGELKTNEYRAIFGAPGRISTETNKDGNFEKAVYYFSRTNVLDTLSYRTLYLEFKDGVLNAYDYVSCFDQDKTTANFQQIGEIKIGRSTKNDVLNLLREPTGKALCPTTLYPNKDECESGGEMWVWRAGNKFSIYNPDAENKAEVHIIFDKNSVVSSVNTYKSVSEK